MAVRDAKFVDIPGIVEVMRRALDRSIYKDTGTFDEADSKQMLLQALHRHGHTNIGGSLVLVSEDSEGEITGFIIGALDTVYPGLKELMATDLLFILDENAAPRDATKMLKRLVEWAQSCAKCIEIHLGVNGAISDYERVGKLYERFGFKRCGAMYRWGIDR